MIVLRNEKITAEVNEQKGADVLKLIYANKNFLDGRGVQAWLKGGKRIDPATGVLGNFYEDIREKPFAITEQTETSATLICQTDSVLITKQIALDENSLVILVDVYNHSSANTPLLQIEFYNMFAGGKLSERSGKFTAILDRNGTPVDILYFENFGERYVKSYDYEENAIILGDAKDDKWLRITASGNSEKVTYLVQGNVITRGFNSKKFSLPPGEKFTFTQRITIETGDIFDAYPQLLNIKDELENHYRNFSKKTKVSLESYFVGTPVFNMSAGHIYVCSMTTLTRIT